MTRKQLIDEIDPEDEIENIDLLSLDDLFTIKMTQQANAKLLRGLLKKESVPVKRFYKQRKAIFYEKD